MSNRPVAGDRVFLSSDHTESVTPSNLGFNNTTSAYGLIQIISVNRAGAVPPGASDYLAGASLTYSGNPFNFEAYCSMFWQGVTITYSGTGNWNFNASSSKSHYIKNSALVLSTTTANQRLVPGGGNGLKIILDNTTFQVGAASQSIAAINNGPMDLTWINTPNAIAGATIPTNLFVNTTVPGSQYTIRGVDLSAITGTIFNTQSAVPGIKGLLESCKIAAGVTLYTPPPAGTNATVDEVELVNCYDGTNVRNERYTPAGSLTTDRSTYMSSGAQDDIGNYSLKLVSNSNNDFAAMPLDAFAFDVENTLTGTSKTATVEVLSLGALNNTDVRLLLEYMGTSGNPIASFVDSLASVLTPVAALSVSLATWNNPPSTITPAWNPSDKTSNVTLSGSNLIATFSAGSQTGGVRSNLSIPSGKYYFELAWTTATAQLGCGIANAGASITTPSGTAIVIVNQGGSIYVNQWSSSAASIGAFSTGNVCCIAIDTVANLIWMRNGASGSWNATSGSANNPATGTGGISISAVAGPYLPYFYGAGTSGGVCTANFGGTSYSGTAPAGFGNIPPLASQAQKLQVTFTPQRAGRVRGLVRLGKPGAAAWINPQVTIT